MSGSQPRLRTLRSSSEATLVRHAISSGVRKELAWSELVRRLEPKLAGVVHHILSQSCEPRNQAIEEVLSAIWMRLQVNSNMLLKRWKPAKGHLSQYLMRLADWETRRWIRGIDRRREVRLDDKVSPRCLTQCAHPGEFIEIADLKRTIESWNSKLSPTERAIFRYRCRRMGFRKIAQIVGRPRRKIQETCEALEEALGRALNDGIEFRANGAD